MLTVTGLTSAEYLISSVALSIDEYYAGVGESPGVWAGKWAQPLGLSGVVEAQVLRALVDGLDPDSGAELMPGSRRRNVRAFDLTFSAPKSVSLFWALGDDEIADVVVACHREAVAVALEFLERYAAAARLQQGGIRRRVATLGWVVAGFVHRTSREGDPQLHTHCLLLNLVRRTADGRIVALDASLLFEWAKAAGSVYQNELQRLLSERLGVEWGPDHHNTREIVGFDCQQLRAFSKRSVQIERDLETRGEVYESPVLRMRADDEASLATRTVKDHSLTPSLLAERWLGEAEAVGLRVGADLERAVCRTVGLGEAPGWEEIAAILVDAEMGVCSKSARFSEANVVEHLCAISGGRLSVDEITALSERFLASDLVVRLSPDGPGGRKAAQWSTVAHRTLEDRTLALIDALAARRAPIVSDAAIDAVLGAVSGLGDDQLTALRVLAGEGGSLRAVLAPAGFGKTTVLHSAARAAAADGRPVLAVATTAKAVAELAGAGMDARTIARLRIELTEGPLAAGTVVVLDEISQTPTDQVEAVLAAVEACPGGSIWVLGDPRQSQPVGPGGIADHIDALAADSVIVSARLTVNRRQVDPADREALDLLRGGEVTTSQKLRARRGWEHEHTSPGQTRQAMADSVCADIDRYGAGQVAALVVSHTDAEDLADRIRARLTETGVLSGAWLTGPGWTTEREYRVGDRVLLHARCGPAGSRLVNGTTATVTGVDSNGLTVRVDKSGGQAVLPDGFVAGTRKDGSPNLSHSWARTVDGAQGGTWEACHLLGSSALDAYRGYTGQSRSRQPTHTWNTAKIAVVDHGGRLADQRTGTDQVADALRRQPDPRLAASSDPWIVDRQLRELIAEHERVLAGRPPDLSGKLEEALDRLHHTQTHVSKLDATADGTADRLATLGPLHGFKRYGRDERREIEARLAVDLAAAHAARQGAAELAAHVAELRRSQEARQRFDTTEGWRTGEILRLRAQIDHHWLHVISVCVKGDDPLAFGIGKLRHARQTVRDDLRALDAAIPADLSKEWNDTRLQLREVINARHDAERKLVEYQRELAEAQRRRRGRHDQQAFATGGAHVNFFEPQAEQARSGETALRERLAAISDHQHQRREMIAASGPQCRGLNSSLALLEAALDHTRAGRVIDLSRQPTARLVEKLGPPPASPSGRAVWCHHVCEMEAALDRGERTAAMSSDTARKIRKEIAIADQVSRTRPEPTSAEYVDPAGWAELAYQAATFRIALERQTAARPFNRMPGWSHGITPNAAVGRVPPGPQIGI